MKVVKDLLGLVYLLLCSLSVASAQIDTPVRWKADYTKGKDGNITVCLTAYLAFNWHIYSAYLPKGGPNPTQIDFQHEGEYSLVGAVVEEGNPTKEHDELFDLDLTYFSDSVKFVQVISPVAGENFEVKGVVDYQTCHEGVCNVGDWEFSIPIDLAGGSEKFVSEAEGMAQCLPTQSRVEADGESANLMFFLLCFLAGLAGLLTPCVFPMIPMTVSFFLGKENRMNALLNAAVFGLSIVAIYTLLGLVVSLTSMGADFITDLTTHWLTNSIFFALFVVFAASFFGMFEIALPSSMINKADSKVGKGGYIGSFFFALTTVIVSLSCVGPIVGTLLVESASGAAVRPVIGMFAFSLGFSLPFTLFAIFPSWLNKLPKSGGWMNSVKIVLGFIVLAFSLKFLLGIDIALNLHLLTRPLYLTIWIALGILLTLYLLGHIRFKLDSPLHHVSFLRMLLALGSLSIVIYLIPGLFGAPLYSLSGLLPAPMPSDFNLSVAGVSPSVNTVSIRLCDTPKYKNFIHLPAGLEGYRDYKQALACAQKQGKPVFVEFSGHGCANCKEMAAKVLSHPTVSSYLMENFIFVALYVDDRYELPESEWYTSRLDGKVKKTIGKQNLDLEMDSFRANGQPLFFVVTPSGEVLAGPRGRDTDVDSFMGFLREARAKFFQVQ